jgi:hypothetical protein
MYGLKIAKTQKRTNYGNETIKNSASSEMDYSHRGTDVQSPHRCGLRSVIEPPP